MKSVPAQRTTSMRAALSLHSLTARHLLLTSRRLVGLPVRGTQTGRSVSDHGRTLPSHWSATSSFVYGSSVFGNRRRSFALRCWLVVAGCSLLVGLAGCGPASSDNAPNLGPRASVGGPPLSKQGPSPGNDRFTPVASPVPLASVNGTGSASGRGTVPGGNSPQAVPVPSSVPAPQVDILVVPAWMAKELDSPDVRVRLRALETWAQSAPLGAVDPLILALEDKDERVQTRAMELIEQDLARESETEK